MARRKPKARVENVLFNVVYEDGTLSSNRRALRLRPAGHQVAETGLGAADCCRGQTIAPGFGYALGLVMPGTNPSWRLSKTSCRLNYTRNLSTAFRYI
jgi:hypothetical protein